MSPLRGIGLKLLSVTVFVAMASLVKAASAHVPPGEVVFFRSFFAIPVIIGWLRLQGDFPAGLRTRRPLAHLWRGLVGTGAMSLGFAGLGLLPLPEARTPIRSLLPGWTEAGSMTIQAPRAGSHRYGRGQLHRSGRPFLPAPQGASGSHRLRHRERSGPCRFRN